MLTGVLAGYEMVDIKVNLIDGTYHEVDSSDVAFQIAGSLGFKECVRKAKPVLLEPMMSIEIVVPEDYIGDAIGDVSSRRGKVQHLDRRGNYRIVNAKIPLAQMFGYATDLRSMTQGRATYSMQFSHYQQVPKIISDEIVVKAQGL
jgi:elongation factor G